MTFFRHLGSDGESLWPAFGLGLAVAVGNGLARFSYALLLPPMMTELGWNYAQAGWLNTANALGYVLGAGSGYLLLRQVSPSRLFVLGLWLTFLTLLVTGVDTGIVWLTVVRLLSGVGAAWVFSCGGALIANRYESSPARRATATGLFFAGAGIGIAVSAVAVNPLLAHTGSGGWAGAWTLLGVLAVLLSVWPLWEARRSHGATNRPSPTPLPLQGLLAPMLSYFLFAAGYIVYMTFILAWLRTEGWSWRFSTLVWLVLGASVALSPFAWRRALDRWNPLLTLAASCAATLAGTLIPLYAPNAAGLLMSATVFGLGLFIAPSSVAVLLRQRMAPANLAKSMTFFTIIFSLGQAIGPVAAGWIGDSTTLSDSLFFGAALLLAASLLPLLGIRRAPLPANHPDPT